MIADGMMIADGLDEAVLGVSRRCGQIDLVAYDVEKIIHYSIIALYLIKRRDDG